MLQQESPDDYVIATGRSSTVRFFIEKCADNLGWGTNKPKSIIWEDKGINEIGRRADTNEIVIRIDPRYFRPTEVEELLGDASKAKNKLGWEPKISLEELIEEMMQKDIEIARRESLLIQNGLRVLSPKEGPPSN